MSAKTPTELRDEIRFRGDYRRSTRYPDPNIDQIAQKAFGRFYELVAQTNEGYWDTTFEAQTVAGRLYMPLPPDHWQLRGVDLVEGSQVCELEQVGVSKRNRYGTTPGRPCAFHPSARGIELYPPPDAVYTIRFTYTPSAPRLFGPQFVGATGATITDGGSAIVVANPTGTMAGDSLLLVIAASTDDGVLQPAAIPNGWEQVVDLTSVALRVLTVWRRAATDNDPTHSFDLVGVGPVGAVLLVYRNLDPTVDVVGSAIADVAASRSFACPSVTTTSYNDVVIGVAWSATGASFIAPPRTGVERFEANQSADGTPRTLEVFDVSPGSVGATAVQTATAGVAQTGGLAASIAFRVGAAREYFSDWDEYVILATMIGLAQASERDTTEWRTAVTDQERRLTGAASGRQSQSPELLVLYDGGDY